MITEKMVTKFAINTALMKRLKEKQDSLWQRIFDALRAGDELPEAGPYTILLAPVGGKEWSWKDAYEDLLIEKLRKEQKLSEKNARALAQSQMKELQEDAPDKKGIKIHGHRYVGGVKMSPRANENYKQEAA